MRHIFRILIGSAFIVCFLFFAGCKSVERTQKKESLKRDVTLFLDQWHQLAAKADYAYFDRMAADGIFIGTDKTENWTRDEFKKWCKKSFDAGKGWDFKATKRNIYISGDAKFIWFDELLDTWMGTCQSSGVISNRKGKLEILHYQLSVAVPNEVVKDVIKVIKTSEKKE